MSRVDQLIAEHCPGGVEFRALGSLGKRNSGTSITAATMRKLAVDDGPVRVFAGGQTIADVAEGDVRPTDIIREPSIIVKSRGNIGFTFYDQPFTHKSELWSYTLTDPAVEQKFVYYFLLTRVRTLQDLARATSVKLPQLGVRDTDSLQIPVPPLEIQREIVRMLDHFTKLEVELEVELEAELKARTLQYAHYRQRLLDQVDAELVEVADLGKWHGGMTPSKANPEYWNSGDIPWLASKDVSDLSTDEIRGRITLLALEETSLKIVPAPSVVVVMRSNILRRRLPIGLIKVDTTVNQDMRALVPHDGVDADYAYQALLAASERIRSECVRTDGSMAAVDSKTFFAFRIPLPSVKEQRNVADGLRKFDALVSDLSVALPAELAARRKQYEHYRDRLLTFKELAA